MASSSSSSGVLPPSEKEMVKNCNSNQISYSMGYRIGKETTFREIEEWFYQNFDDMGFHVISNEEITLKEMMDDLKKHLNIK